MPLLYGVSPMTTIENNLLTDLVEYENALRVKT